MTAVSEAPVATTAKTRTDRRWLGDIYGRKRMLMMGTTGFPITSTLCAIAPTTGALIGTRGPPGPWPVRTTLVVFSEP